MPERVPLFHTNGTDKTNQSQSPSKSESHSYGDLHQRLLEQYAPPSVVITEEYEIVHISERAGRYLQISGGEPSQNLLKLIRPELRLELRTALYQAVQRQIAVDTRSVTVSTDDHPETLTMHVRPVLDANDRAKGFILVLFDRVKDADAEPGFALTSDEPVSRQLEEELLRLKNQLRGSNEHHEYQAEELKASNEELQAMNEELRSAAEELETSKEELQSINEELRTVNQELKVKVEETMITTNYLHNLINSVDIGTIFLDRRLYVAFFTPAARALFNLISNDIGRPLSDITNKLDYSEIIQDAETVLEKLQTIERELTAHDGRTFMFRLLPYRTHEDKINGVIVTFFDITERKRLEESRYYLASIVESSRDSVITVDFNNIVTSWNKAAEALFGYTAREVMGKPLNMLSLPADLKNLLSDLDHIRNSKEVDSSETIRINKDGEHVQLEVMLSPVRNPAGETIGVSTIARDITERKKAEEALRESEEQFRTVANLVPDLLWSNDTQGNTSWYNQRWFDYTGQTFEEAGGFGWLAAIHPEEREGSSVKFRAAVDSGQPLLNEHRIRRHDGEYHWFLVRAEPLRDKHGTITRWFGTATDIHEVRTAFDNLRESRERLRITMESASDYAIMTLDVDGNFTNWSKGAELILGYTAEEALGQHSRLIFTPEDRAAGAPEKEIQQAIAEGKGEDERWHERKNGTRFYMSGVVRPLTNNGKLIGFVKVARDLTVRKLLEQQKDEFIGMASHELKTPVTSIKAYTELLLEMFIGTSDSQSVELISKLNIQVDRLIQLIHSLLDTTRISEGKMPLKKQSIDVTKLAEECISELKGSTTRHRILLRKGSTNPVSADKIRIEQVITNLINNAIQYSPNGGDIIVETSEVNGGVKVSVADHGVGIPEEAKGKVFGRFFRINSPEVTYYPGMGLGLYIAEGIIQSHGGTISFESIEGKGSIFAFTLPY